MDLAPLLLEGALVTIQVAVLSWLLAIPVAVAAGLARLSRLAPVRAVSAVYVEVFRGTSLLVQLFWLYFALPFIGIELPKLAAAVLAVGLNYAAYGSEIVRSAVLAVPKGQQEASIALNFTPRQRMMRIIFPQALLRMVPPFGNLSIELLKSTSLVYFITLADLTSQTLVLRNNYVSLTPQLFTALLLIYFALACVVAGGFKLVERQLQARR